MDTIQQEKSDESARAAHLKWTTNNLPPFPKNWTWNESETYALRAASKVRFDEDIRTETLYAIGAVAIRIYLDRINQKNN